MTSPVINTDAIKLGVLVGFLKALRVLIAAGLSWDNRSAVVNSINKVLADIGVPD